MFAIKIHKMQPNPKLTLKTQRIRNLFHKYDAFLVIDCAKNNQNKNEPKCPLLKLKMCNNKNTHTHIIEDISITLYLLLGNTLHRLRRRRWR